MAIERKGSKITIDLRGALRFIGKLAALAVVVYTVHHFGTVDGWNACVRADEANEAYARSRE